MTPLSSCDPFEMYGLVVLCLLASAFHIRGKVSIVKIHNFICECIFSPRSLQLEVPSQEILLHDATVNPRTCGKFYHMNSTRVRRIIKSIRLETFDDNYYDRVTINSIHKVYTIY